MPSVPPMPTLAECCDLVVRCEGEVREQQQLIEKLWEKGFHDSTEMCLALIRLDNLKARRHSALEQFAYYYHYYRRAETTK